MRSNTNKALTHEPHRIKTKGQHHVKGKTKTDMMKVTPYPNMQMRLKLINEAKGIKGKGRNKAGDYKNDLEPHAP